MLKGFVYTNIFIIIIAHLLQTLIHCRLGWTGISCFFHEQFFLLFQFDMTIGAMAEPYHDSTGTVQLWKFHRVAERSFVMGYNDSWSLWLISLSNTTANISYNISIAPLPTPVCELPISTNCIVLNYSYVSMPNFAGMQDKKKVYEFEMGMMYLPNELCHLHLLQFFCLYAYPKCKIDDDGSPTGQIEMPCQEFCDEVAHACKRIFEKGKSYLSGLESKCSLLPTKFQNPQCVHPQVDCGKPPRIDSITNGHWSFNSTVAGNDAALICPSGHSVTGTSNIRCGFNGNWTQTEAKCIDYRGLHAGIGSAVAIIVLFIIAIPLVYKWRYEIKVLVYNKICWLRCQKQKEQSTKLFDAFVSFGIKVKRRQTDRKADA